MDNELLGYLLQLDDPAALQRVEERLRSDPDLARKRALLEKALAPLESDREPPAPPADLVARTLGFVAEHVVRAGPPAEPRPSDDPAVGELLVRVPPERMRQLIEIMDRSASGPGRSRRVDVAVVVAILLITTGIVLAAVPYVRHRQHVAMCQNQMREIHGALEVYADAHGGRYPQVTEEPPYNTAAAFWNLLRDAGTLADTVLAGCPSGEGGSTYAYTLGWRDRDGTLHALVRDPNSEFNDMLPILADRPHPARDGTPSPDHRTGQNVLYTGGNVRFCTDYLAGVNRDNIYCNYFHKVGAGLTRKDSSLGADFEQP